MFFMSFWDLVSSVAIALTTLPMPDDVKTVYHFTGPTYGSVSYCEIQAFLILLGSIFTIFSNLALNIYYVSTIRFGVSEQKFNKVALPVILVLAISTILPLVSMLLVQDLLNPVPYYPYCMVGTYPHDCLAEDTESECIRGGASGTVTVRIFETSLSIALPFGLITILISMILVISTVFRTETEAKRNAASAREQEEGNDNGNSLGDLDTSYSANAAHNHTRAVLRQALMYIGAFLLTWGWTVMCTNRFLFRPAIDQLKFVFQPLQGFFNAFIFIYAKVDILRRASQNLSFGQALKRVIISPKAVPEMLVSRMEMVHNDHAEMNVIGEPGECIVRRGALFRRTDECPRAVAQGALSDLESMDTPSAGMALSHNGKIANTSIDLPSGCSAILDEEDGGSKEHQGKKSSSPRLHYEWPPPSGWSTFLSEKSSNHDANSTKSKTEGSKQSSGNYSTGGMLSWNSSSHRHLSVSAIKTDDDDDDLLSISCSSQSEP